MKILIVVPHVFAPRIGSLYSSQTEDKRETKAKALQAATVQNLNRHSSQYWLHASLGKLKPIVTRKLSLVEQVKIDIQVYTPRVDTLAGSLATFKGIDLIDPGVDNYLDIPAIASRRALEQFHDYDIIGYIEDDLLIEDPEFFAKLRYLHGIVPRDYALIPHRCEHIHGKGDVIMSGDPDGGRPDLFWDTGEQLKIRWPTGDKTFYRATNPHSGCYFLSQEQARLVCSYWESRSWKSDFCLSGPLEQAASGLLLPVLKLMKPIPSDYRFLMIRHQDELWKRHPFELDSERT